jgi:hypothetical protein
VFIDENVADQGSIATFNTRDFAGVASQFGIAVLTPAEILRRL